MVVIVIICVLMLAGCSDYRESNSQYMVSAVGFDADGDNVVASIQAVIVGTDSINEEAEIKVFSADGSTPSQAISNIFSFLSKSLLFDHCGVVAIGNGISSEMLGDIFDYSADQKNLNLGVYFVATDNAQKLLRQESVSALASGYDIMGMIERNSDETGILYQNRFYEIKALEAKKGKVFSLPFFKCSGDGIKMDGRNIYRNRQFVTNINETESYIYSVLSNSNNGGKILLGEQKAKINKMHTKFNFDYKNNKFEIDLKTIFSFEYKTKNFKKTLENDGKALIKKMTDNGYGDVFGFEDRVYIRDRSLYNSLKDNFEMNVKYETK